MQLAGLWIIFSDVCVIQHFLNHRRQLVNLKFCHITIRIYFADMILIGIAGKWRVDLYYSSQCIYLYYWWCWFFYSENEYGETGIFYFGV